jgi:hypothetical protein
MIGHDKSFPDLTFYEFVNNGLDLERLNDMIAIEILTFRKIISMHYRPEIYYSITSSLLPCEMDFLKVYNQPK